MNSVLDDTSRWYITPWLAASSSTKKFRYSILLKAVCDPRSLWQDENLCPYPSFNSDFSNTQPIAIRTVSTELLACTWNDMKKKQNIPTIPRHINCVREMMKFHCPVGNRRLYLRLYIDVVHEAVTAGLRAVQLELATWFLILQHTWPARETADASGVVVQAAVMLRGPRILDDSKGEQHCITQHTTFVFYHLHYTLFITREGIFKR